MKMYLRGEEFKCGLCQRSDFTKDTLRNAAIHKYAKEVFSCKCGATYKRQTDYKGVEIITYNHVFDPRVTVPFKWHDIVCLCVYHVVNGENVYPGASGYKCATCDKFRRATFQKCGLCGDQYVNDFQHPNWCACISPCWDCAEETLEGEEHYEHCWRKTQRHFKKNPGYGGWGPEKIPGTVDYSMLRRPKALDELELPVFDDLLI